jgi:hypothetical protein
MNIPSFTPDLANRDVLVCSSATPADSQSWSGNTAVEGQTSAGSPSLAVFKGKLFVAFVSNNGDRDILVCSSSTPADSQSWSGNTQAQGQSSAEDPSLAVFDGRLWVAFISNDGNRKVLVCSSGDGNSWTDNTQV